MRIVKGEVVNRGVYGVETPQQLRSQVPTPMKFTHEPLKEEGDQ